MYKIIDVKYKLSEGFAMIPGSIIISFKITDGEKIYWLSNINVDGIDNYYLTEKSIILGAFKETPSDKTIKYLNDHTVNSFDGYNLDDTIPDQLKKNHNPIIKLLYYVPRMEYEEARTAVSYVIQNLAKESKEK